MDKEAVEKVAELHSHWFGSSISNDWQPLYGGLSFTHDLSNMLYQLGYRKPLDRPELREKIEELTETICFAVRAYERFDISREEFQLIDNSVTEDLLALIIPKDKPPLLSDRKIREIISEWEPFTVASAPQFGITKNVAQAQREAGIKFYGGEE